MQGKQWQLSSVWQKNLSCECLPEFAGILPLSPWGCSKGKGCHICSIPDSYDMPRSLRAGFIYFFLTLKKNGARREQNLTLTLCSLDEWLSHDSEANSIYLLVKKQKKREGGDMAVQECPPTPNIFLAAYWSGLVAWITIELDASEAPLITESNVMKNNQRADAFRGISCPCSSLHLLRGACFFFHPSLFWELARGCGIVAGGLQGS